MEQYSDVPDIDRVINENILVTSAEASAVVSFSLQVFICVWMMARGRGLGFEEDETPGRDGRRIPRDTRPMVTMTRTRENNGRL